MGVTCDKCGAEMPAFEDGPAITEVCVDQWRGASVIDDKRFSLFVTICDGCYSAFQQEVVAMVQDSLVLRGGGKANPEPVVPGKTVIPEGALGKLPHSGGSK